MTNRVDETERERQLRELASSLLTHPEPDGPVSVDLVPGGYPDELPAGMTDQPDLRLLGSLVRRRAGAFSGAELVFEGTDEPDVVLGTYEAALLGHGWERIDQMGPVRGGFEARGFGAMSVLLAKDKQAVVFLHATDREVRGCLLKVRYDTGRAVDMIGMRHGGPNEEVVLPVLRPPAGVRMQGEGFGGGGGRWTSDARADTEMAPIELEAHFGKQLEAAGWGRLKGSADEVFAWSSWTIPMGLAGGDWRGVLLVMAAFPGSRALSLRAELAARPRGGGPQVTAVSTLSG